MSPRTYSYLTCFFLVMILVDSIDAQTIVQTKSLTHDSLRNCSESDCNDTLDAISDALLMEKRGDTEAAIESLRSAVKTEKTPRAASKQLGRIYLSTGAYSDAISYLLAAKESSRNDEEVLQWLGQAYFKSGKLRESLESFNSITRIEAASSSVLLDYSAALDKNNQCKKAFDVALIAHDSNHLGISIDFPTQLRLLHVNCFDQSNKALANHLKDAQQSNSLAPRMQYVVPIWGGRQTTPGVQVIPSR